MTMMWSDLTDEQRHPLLDERGARLLNQLREHPHAPRFNWRIGDRLTATGLANVRAYEAELRAAEIGWGRGELPSWLHEFVAYCYRAVPFYRAFGELPANFTDIPTTDRADLSRAPELFVPDELPLDDLIFYGSTGTTGHHIHVPSHPTSAARYITLLKQALAVYGVTLEGGPDRVAIANVGFQERTATYAAIMSYLDASGVVKLNLNPAEWNDPGDRAAFLNDLAPEMITGDPLSFAELIKLDLTVKPKALSSTALQLEKGLRRALEIRFGCPVVDVYAMTEAGPIAVRVDGAFQLLQHRLYVETLNDTGQVCGEGERGEITLTGGMNPYFPLLRYRTSDSAVLAFAGTRPLLTEFHGRPPILFYGVNGHALSSADVNRSLREFSVWQFTLHQNRDGSLLLRVCNPSVSLEQIRKELLRVFGAEQPLEIVQVDSFGAQSKIVQYTSDMPTARLSRL